MFVWKSSLELGVPEIDAQHKALFDMAGAFSDAAEAREPAPVLEEFFNFLGEYAMDHFAAEERVMRDADYPELAQHLKEHARFKRQLASLVSQWSSEGASPAVLLALNGFLQLWLDEHVSTSDQRIGKYLALNRGPTRLESTH